MQTVRKAAERGHESHGWLDTWHTFSFAEYLDPEHMGFGPLRVINDDTVAPGGGFPTHGHRDMEILSYVLEGALEHRDSAGNGSVIRPGDVQRMSAGTGIRHSEANASRDRPVHFLQIWIVPDRQGLPPAYEQKHFTEDDRRGRFRLVASPDGEEGSVRVHQAARVYAAIVDADHPAKHDLGGRDAWLHVARGSVVANGTPLQAGDGLAMRQEDDLAVTTTDGGEVLLFELA